MFNMGSQNPLPDSYHHKRAKTSVLSSLPFMHKRNPSDGPPRGTHPPVSYLGNLAACESTPFLPNDNTQFRALGELHQNQQSQFPPEFKPKEGKRPTTSDERSKPLHKKTLSTLSLKALAGKDSEKKEKSKEPKTPKPKKTKSSTNLANLLSRPKSSKSLRKDVELAESQAQKDKENQNPSRETSTDSTRPPPIYAQFSTEYFTKQPLGGKFLEDEIDLYTPKEDHSPSKQRNFYLGPDSQPSLVQREGPQRPKSTYLPSTFSMKDITRKVSNGSRQSFDIVRRASGETRPSLDRRVTDLSNNSGKSTKRYSLSRATTEVSVRSDKSEKVEKTPKVDKTEKAEKSGTSRSRRVINAVSSFGSKHSKHAAADEVPIDAGPALDDKDVDREFEAMLDRRNIPEHQRGKMRSLAMTMKKDFVRQDWAETAAGKSSRPGTNSSDSSADAATTDARKSVEIKSKRPRSRTFTFSRASHKDSSSPTKKSEGNVSKHSRTKSSDSTVSGTKSLGATGAAAIAQNLIAKAKGQTADDFVSYLRKVQKPELIEVGRLHKLRLLLRNETVAWTDDFIKQGGLEEIVGLLHRTMEVEWREEHEDALLHEALLCMKAVSTTALALHHLNTIQKTLFPALLAMVFDEEKKGPSEFTTRNIITSLLFTFLKSAPLSERTERAQTLLSYLRNPIPTESQRPVDFVLDMRRPRPYTVWNKEVTNVTKEVFWIFLHNLNVIALPGSSRRRDGANDSTSGNETSDSVTSKDGFDASNAHHVYMAKHFPSERPPVPAAPYVGGVEWDATNYLASHLDILNGIIASIPTQAERNTLREQLLVSGWEKCMGCTLRLCKEKFYGAVHDGLRCWVAAAAADGWDTKDVRCGPCVDNRSPKKSPKKAGAPAAPPPKIEMKLDFTGSGERKAVATEDMWL